MTDAPRRLLVWRHGETTYNAAGRWQGQFDAPLSERGREQVATAAKLLAAYGPSRIVASDLSRAADTGQALADEADIPISFDKRFREVDVGDWSGLTSAEVRARTGDLLDRIDAGEDLRRGGTGETISELAARVEQGALEVVAQLEPGETVVIACHGMTSRTLCAALVGMPQYVAWTSLQGMSNCHWAALQEHGTGWRIAGWNLPR
ncbi:histidine phosphatase family protein [Flexivirga sp. ID2601S]|uniref:Histidine phosphatase family protein n=1 Tax=Flexivirga aerilata TaxID=1656889 RepID=A0A849AM84_9MICO|nr:histidine phosphatase family protein [Flexivirga aerilata]